MSVTQFLLLSHIQAFGVKAKYCDPCFNALFVSNVSHCLHLSLNPAHYYLFKLSANIEKTDHYVSYKKALKSKSKNSVTGLLVTWNPIPQPQPHPLLSVLQHQSQVTICAAPYDLLLCFREHNVDTWPRLSHWYLDTHRCITRCLQLLAVFELGHHL